MDKRVNVNGLKAKLLWMVVLVSCGAMSGCTLIRGSDSADATLDPQLLTSYVSNQEDVYQALLKLAGLPDSPANAAEWNQFIMAGVQYSNQKCEAYLSSSRTGADAANARSLVHGLQQQFVEKLNANQYTNRVAAFSVLQSYISLCLPGNIEAAAAGNARVVQPGKSADGSLNSIPYVTTN